jgi:4-hydroxy-2-oxoheptanedioate aldolase
MPDAPADALSSPARHAGMSLLMGIPAPDMARLAIEAGMHSVVLDCEHGFPLGIEVQRVAAAAQAAGGKCLVRVTRGQLHHVGPLLDLGVDGLVMSGVKTPGELREASMAAWHPPRGQRSVNPFVPAAGIPGDEGSLLRSARSLELWAMAETIEFLEGWTSPPKVAAEPWLAGWTGIIVGPYDLAAALGCRPDVHDAALRRAVAAYLKAAKAAGLAAGLFARSPQVLSDWLATGLSVDHVLAGYDRDVWFRACADVVSAMAGTISVHTGG